MRTAASAVLALAAAACAQSSPKTISSSATFNLTWNDVGGAANGIIEPGESVRLRISVSFTSQNQNVYFAPPVSGISFGTIRGFSFAFLDLVGIGNQGGNANGTWNTSPASGYGPITAWDLVGPSGYGTPSANGSRLDAIQFGQFPITPASVLTTNPINFIYSALWTPSSYAGRFVDFYIRDNAAAGGFPSGVILQITPTQIIGATCPAVFSHVSIPVGIPAPSSLGLLGLAALAAARRRR